MKDLDKECIELNRELMEVENSYIDSQAILKKRKFDAPDENTTIETTEALKKSSEQYLDKINLLRILARQKLAEKTAIAINMVSIIERFSRKLDTDLAFFETDLKGCGEFETPKGAEPGSEVGIYLYSYIYTVVKMLNCYSYLYRLHSVSLLMFQFYQFQL